MENQQTHNEKPQHGRWIRAALWYRRTPVLKHIDPIAFPVILISIMLLLIFPRGECTCEEQLPDKSISAMAVKGNAEALSYLNAKDNALLCAARRQELLRKLEEEKKTKRQYKL